MFKQPIVKGARNEKQETGDEGTSDDQFRIISVLYHRTFIFSSYLCDINRILHEHEG